MKRTDQNEMKVDILQRTGQTEIKAHDKKRLITLSFRLTLVSSLYTCKK